jgi:hypothetical protein
VDGRIVLILLIVLLAAGSVSAYIDPGTGGMIISGLGGAIWPIIAAFFAGVVGLFVKYFSLIKRGLLSLWSRISGRR